MTPPSAAPLTLWVQLATAEGHVAAMLARLANLDHVIKPLTRDRDGKRHGGEEGIPDVEIALQAGEQRHDGEAALAQLMMMAAGALGPGLNQSLRSSLFGAVETIAKTTNQATYERACREYFDTLRAQDEILSERRFLGGERPNIADLWLFAALVRHDPAHLPFYKLTLARLEDFDHLGDYARDVFQLPGFADLVMLREIRRHHAWRSERLNPKRRVPTGGLPDLWRPHDRHQRFATRPLSDAGTEETQPQPGALGWIRPRSAHRAWIEDRPGARHPLESGRYHLYVSHNCPWSHRANLARSMLGLEDAVSMDVLFYRRDPDRGWQFRPEEEGCTPDRVFGAKFIREIYEREGSKEKSVPLLFDKLTETIVNNESAEIVRMFHTVLRPLARRPLELLPEGRDTEITLLNQWIYQRINNGAYKAGFSSAQEAHEDAAEYFFDALEGLEHRLSDGRAFLLGDTPTEPDLRLFPTLFRFDDVYFTRFLLNRKKLEAYPHLEAWRGRMLSLPGVREASRLDHCKKGYFGRTGNGLVPLTPEAL
ncbi:MAG: glutathione S-transferase C-terminal domain-containing protein [Myxococcota bacterium]